MSGGERLVAKIVHQISGVARLQADAESCARRQYAISVEWIRMTSSAVFFGVQTIDAKFFAAEFRVPSKGSGLPTEPVHPSSGRQALLPAETERNIGKIVGFSLSLIPRICI